ncbi:MAG: SpaA isopeptide-forming pilin-related protein, partial [Clostridiaceae bacterium]
NKVDSDNKPLTGAEFRLDKFVANEKGEDTYNDMKGTWTPITAVKNQDGTVFTFAGLDDGEYRLIETVTPDGYNSIDPIYFTVTAEHDVESNNPALKSLNGDATKGEIDFTDNLVDGSLSADVVNNSGATLPETGGMGTTLFYVIGGGLVLVAIVLLITKRRIKM